MDGIKTIDDLIRAKNLTPEELIQFKDMIDEFKEREKQIEEYTSSAKSNLHDLSYSLRRLGERASILGTALRESLDRLERVQLQLMPRDKFYRE